MSKLVVIAVMLSVLGLQFIPAASSHGTYRFDSLQIAGDVTPNGG